MTRRVVVTGYGMTTPLGVTTGESWAGLVNGKSGIRVVDEWKTMEFAGHKLPVTIAGIVPDFNAEDWTEHKKDAKRMERFILLAQAAAKQAWDMSGLPAKLSDDEGDRAGCITAHS